MLKHVAAEKRSLGRSRHVASPRTTSTLVPDMRSRSAATRSSSMSTAVTLVVRRRSFVDLRTCADVRAGAWPYEGPDVVTGWHHHPYHQVEYALTGVAEVETPTGRFLLPPQQAIWIPAGLRHNTTLRGVRSVSVFFDPEMMPTDRAAATSAEWSR